MDTRPAQSVGSVFMDSGLAPSARPGMTLSVFLARTHDQDQADGRAAAYGRPRPRGTTEASARGRTIIMDMVGRRRFVQGAALGALAFTVSGVETLLTPRQAR